jgi:hypothetical protein
VQRTTGRIEQTKTHRYMGCRVEPVLLPLPRPMHSEANPQHVRRAVAPTLAVRQVGHSLVSVSSLPPQRKPPSFWPLNGHPRYDELWCRSDDARWRNAHGR